MIDDMKTMVNSMLGDIITTPINNQTRMFVILNSIKYISRGGKNKIDNRAAFFKIGKEANGFGNCIERCELLDPDKLRENKHDIGVLQKVQQLTAVLKHTEVHPDEQVFLITWDHGSAFGIFKKGSRNHKLTIKSVRSEIDQNLSQFPFIKLFWDRINEKDQKGFLRKDLGENSYTTIQLGHSLVKAKNTANNQKWLQYHENKKSEFVYNAKIAQIKLIDENKKATNVKPDVDLENILKNVTRVRTLKVEPRAAEILKNRELAQCLEGWLDTKKVAVLLMSNCSMMNLHTMYALKDQVECLVAPQGSIDIPGYNLKDIFTAITNSTGEIIKSTELAIKCVESIENSYSKAKALILDRSEPGVIERYKIFAVDLSRKIDGNSCLENQINLFKSLCGKLFSLLRDPTAQQDLKYFFKYIRSVCFDFSEGLYQMIDIVNWLESVKEANFLLGDQMILSLPSLPVATAITEFLDSVSAKNKNLNNIVLKSSGGEKAYTIENSTTPWPAIGLLPTGYSIFFPIIYRSVIDPDLINLKDSISDDPLLTELESWRDFLGEIDPNLKNFFVELS